LPEITILLIEPDLKTAGFLRHMFVQAGYQLLHAASGKDGLIQAWRDQPAAIVLELDLPDVDGLDIVRRLRKDRRTASTPIFGLTSRSRPDQLKAGLAAGLNEYVVKQADAVQILLRSLAALPRGERAPVEAPGAAGQPARLLVFLSANGGSGTSSLCLNAAHEFTRLRPGSHVCAMDLVLPLGSLGYLTGCDPRTDLVRLTDKPAQELTPEVLQGVLPLPSAWAFQLLPGSSNPSQVSSLKTERLGPLVQAMRSAFDYVLVDIGRNLSPLAMLVLAQADLLAIVFSPDPATLGNTRALMSYLEVEEIPPSKFFLLSNLPHRIQGLSSEELERTLGRKVEAAVFHAGENLSRANALHVPLSLRFGDENSTRTLQQAAARLLERVEAEAS
jgi:Flp pilus assembly CpaE family ATPase